MDKDNKERWEAYKERLEAMDKDNKERLEAMDEDNKERLEAMDKDSKESLEAVDKGNKEATRKQGLSAVNNRLDEWEKNLELEASQIPPPQPTTPAGAPAIVALQSPSTDGRLSPLPRAHLRPPPPRSSTVPEPMYAEAAVTPPPPWPTEVVAPPPHPSIPSGGARPGQCWEQGHILCQLGRALFVISGPSGTDKRLRNQIHFCRPRFSAAGCFAAELEASRVPPPEPTSPPTAPPPLTPRRERAGCYRSGHLHGVGASRRHHCTISSRRRRRRHVPPQSRY
ncbi:protein enabled homolog [Schistocerca gregaria]|uniref:protein enabled homolog n=1 Tax=Schistocerca gregaria TaxID=7010 RepID=UPI00211E6D01|nr:protein enabled homolog [Schistocerca gregaria]